MDKDLKNIFEKAHDLGYSIEDFTKFNNAVVNKSVNIEELFANLFELETKISVNNNYNDLEEILSSYLKQIEDILRKDTIYSFTSPTIREEINDLILNIRKKFIASKNAKKSLEDLNAKEKELSEIIESINALSKRNDIESKEKSLIYLDLYSKQEEIKRQIEVLQSKVQNDNNDYLEYQNNLDLIKIKEILVSENQRLMDLIKMLPLSKYTFNQLEELNLSFKKGFIDSFGTDNQELKNEFNRIIEEFGIIKHYNKDKEKSSKIEEHIKKDNDSSQDVIFQQIFEAINNTEAPETKKRANDATSEDTIDIIPTEDIINNIIADVKSFDDFDKPAFNELEKHKEFYIDRIIDKVQTSKTLPDEFKVTEEKTIETTADTLKFNLSSIIGLVKQKRTVELVKRASIRAYLNISDYISKKNVNLVHNYNNKLMNAIEELFKSEEVFEELEGFKNDYVELQVKTQDLNINSEVANKSIRVN